MFQQPMPRSEFHPDDSSLDSIETLEQHLLAGFPPDLALDLVLNELVVRAAEATHATAAALALARGGEMVCRAATGNLAPDLGVPLNIRDGLSGACLQTRQPQLSVDTEFDPRIDPVVSRRLGIRSILIVPVFDSSEKNSQFAGILEVFSTSPAAFSHADQKLLEGFAEECAHVRRAAVELSLRKPVTESPELLPRDPPVVQHVATVHPPYEAWSLALGALAILATIALSFLIGSRIGWLKPAVSQSVISDSCIGTAVPGCPTEQGSAPVTAVRRSVGLSDKAPAKRSTPTPTTSDVQGKSGDELVVYEKGKVVFRMKPVERESNPSESKSDGARSTKDRTSKSIASGSISTRRDRDFIVEASSTKKIAAALSVWLSPTQADSRLLSRTEPQYPPDALAAHRAGSVVLEVHVAEDGSVSTVRTLSGDATLAAAAAEAVRNWRYQPYRQHDHASQFQTDVTLSFALPN